MPVGKVILVPGTKIGYEGFWFQIATGLQFQKFEWRTVPIATFTGTELPSIEARKHILSWLYDCDENVIVVWLGPNISAAVEKQ